jgi:hypothetical protein
MIVYHILSHLLYVLCPLSCVRNKNNKDTVFHGQIGPCSVAKIEDYTYSHGPIK